MAWSPIELYYKNLLTEFLAITLEDPAYPKENLISRIDGTFWKSTSAVQQVTVTMAAGSSRTTDYLLMHGHNMAGNFLSVEKRSIADSFSNSSLNPLWTTAVSGGGSVVETTSLAITSPVAADAAILMELASFSTSTKKRWKLKSSVTTCNQTVTLSGLMFRETPAIVATVDADVLCNCYITSAGAIRARYYDVTAAAFKYYNASTGLWDTTSTNDLYAGALSTYYNVDLICDGSNFCFVLMDANKNFLAKTTWIAFSAARESGTGALTWFAGDPYTSLGTCAMTCTRGEVASVYSISIVPDNKTLLLTWNSTAGNTWYVELWPFNGSIPFIAGLQLGEKVVLDFADSITPHDLENKGVVNVGDTGVVQGIHNKFIEHTLQIKFLDADTALLAKIQAWESEVGLGLFGIRWDPGDHSTDIRMMRRKDGKFTAPCKTGGAYNDLTMNLIGKKE